MKTLIIGSGVSAATYAATFPREQGEQVTMSKGTHLWERMDPQHVIGQPKALLVGQTLGTNADRSLTEAKPNPKTFMKAGEFAKSIDTLLKTQNLDCVWDRSWVQTIRKAEHAGFLVKVSTLCPGAPSPPAATTRRRRFFSTRW